MPQSRARIVGSGFTTFNWRGNPIAMADSVKDSGQRPMPSASGAGYEAITPLDSLHPVEIVTTRVVGAGTLSLVLRELWNEAIWNRLAGLDTVGDTITDIYDALRNDPTEVTCQMLVKPPISTTWHGKLYHNCVIVEVDDGDEVTVGGLSIAKAITVAYTHKTSFRQPAA